MNMAPGGTAALVELRERSCSRRCATTRSSPPSTTTSRTCSGSWFNRGFLELRRIDWKTPAAILEKLIAYEAVHEIQGFPDLKRRLERDRRCFAFFHPALPDEPLIFVEVAFVNELPAHVAPILALESAVGDPRRARCAVFYSITSCQPGLRGISFGNFLIKQVAEDLHAELPNLKIFATLSPMPGMRAWARKALQRQTARGADAIAPAARLTIDRVRAAAGDAASRSRARGLVPHARMGERTRRSIPSRASTSATARGWSGSTGWPTPRTEAWRSPSGSW